MGGYFPGGLIADRTALENAPASEGSVCLVSQAGGDIALSGLRLRPRRGVAPLGSDRPFIGGLALSSTARAYLENMRVSRTRGDVLPRTLSPRKLEERLDTLLRRSGQETFNKLREDIRTLAPKLAMQAKVPDR